VFSDFCHGLLGLRRCAREIGIRRAVGDARFDRAWCSSKASCSARSGWALDSHVARTAVPGFVVATNPLGAIVLLVLPALLATAMMIACWIPERRGPLETDRLSIRMGQHPGGLPT
jgi:hypothetical protein